MKSKSSILVLFLGIFLVFTAHAKDNPKTTTIDCSTDSLEAEINKLDKSIPNIVEFTGDCPGLITIKGHRDLTLLAIDGASISGEYVPEDFLSSVTALDIVDSRVALQNATINSGRYGMFCTERSTCTLRDVIVQGGHYGVAAQSQSTLDIQGATSIQDSEVWGVSSFGASRVNMSPNWDSGFDPTEPGPSVSGHSVGVWVMDGSFFRSDNVAFTANGTGIVAQRDVMIKVFSNESGLGVTDSVGDGIIVRQNSAAQVLAPVTGNGGSGIQVASLSYLQAIGELVNGNGGEDIACVDVTASSAFCPSLTQTINDLQAQVAALTNAANASLSEKVAGKTYVVRSTAHGSGGINTTPQPSPPLSLDDPQRDFSLADGALTLAEDGSYDLQLLLTIVPMKVSGLYEEINDIPLGNSGIWEVDASTNEIVLKAVVDGEVVGEQRLQSTPSGEVLTIVSTDKRLVKGDPEVGGFFNTFYADSVYIQLPASE